MSVEFGAKAKAPWQHPAPEGGKHHHLSSAQKGGAKRWAGAHGLPYPSLVANLHASSLAHKK
jgi:hypothetical protein